MEKIEEKIEIEYDLEEQPSRNIGFVWPKSGSGKCC